MQQITLSNSKKIAIVDNDDYLRIINMSTKTTWRESNNGYAICTKKINGKLKNIRMHRVVLSAKDGEIVDHKNGNKMDNRKSNLRICDAVENCRNRNARKDKSTLTSRFKGVCYEKQTNKFKASFTIKGKRKTIGRFFNEIDAAKAYNFFVKKHFGKFANLNEIPNE